MIVGALVYAAVLGTVFGVAASVLERALERARGPVAHGRRWLWAAALGGTVLVPAWALTHAAVRAPDSSRLEAAIQIGTGTPGALRDADAGRSRWFERARAWVAAAPTSFAVPASWGALDRPLLALWAASSLILLARQGAATFRVRRLVRAWPVVVLPAVARVAGQGSGVRAQLRAHVTGDLGPAVVGALRPVLVVPRWALADPRLALMLAHEHAHMAAGDPLLRAAATCAAALVPWSPAAWWQLARLRAAVELDCDARVLRVAGTLPTSDRAAAVRAYGALLLDVAARPDAHALPGAGQRLALAAPPTLLRRRIDAMPLPGSPRARLSSFAGAVAAGAVGAAACAVPRPVALRPAALQLTSMPAAAAEAATGDPILTTTAPPSYERPAAPSPALAPTDQPRKLSVMAARNTTRTIAPLDPVQTRPTIVPDTPVVLANTAAATRYFDSVGTAMRARVRVDTTLPRDSARTVQVRRFRISAGGRDSVVFDVTPVDAVGRPTGPTDRRALPADPARTATSDSALILVNGREVGRGLRSLGEFSTDSVVSMNVLKGDRAVQTYGERGRQGVIEIATRARRPAPAPKR